MVAFLNMAKARKGLKFEAVFCPGGQDPFTTVEWVQRDCEILNVHGARVFFQEGVSAPRSWSNLAVGIAASKYFRRRGVPKRYSSTGGETSVAHLVARVVSTIAKEGGRAGYFASPRDAKNFARDLSYLCLHQMAAFNSPVWFNCGLYHRYGIRGQGQLWRYDERRRRTVPVPDVYKFPQTSACFILSVADDLASIFSLAQTEALIFKFGSGAGANFSRLRGKNEPLESGGESSGLLAFLEVLDRGAGATKSGGTTRRAAKMVILDVDHPEISDFIRWKVREEEKARALMAAGYSGGLDGEAYRTVSGQNSNNSVRVSNEFMAAVERNEPWRTHLRTTGATATTWRARDLWREMATAAWACADPGVQFHDTINRWHTCPQEGPITASNPCSEYMFVDDSACNLASLNLAKFLRTDGGFEIEKFKAAVRLVFVAQEILVSCSAYPTPKVAENSFRLRPLGLGYANLGGLLMRQGLAYDSGEGRALAAALTALMGGEAYRVSAELAKVRGPFASFRKNKKPMLKVIHQHREALKNIAAGEIHRPVVEAARGVWDEALHLGSRSGFRNSQTTVLAPTGTIGLFMDCETTGIEPDFALLKSKSLAGGGQITMINPAVTVALQKLGYPSEVRVRALEHLEKTGSLEGFQDLKPEHLSVFDCAQRLKPRGRSLSAMAHLQMMAAVQPFLSGAISKTINLPAETDVDQIEDIYLQAWRMGLKAVAIYRDTAKSAQPLKAGWAPTCSACGHSTERSGNCFKCLNCGHSESCG